MTVREREPGDDTDEGPEPRVLPPGVTELEPWKKLLRKIADKNGEPKLVSCTHNVALILTHDVAFRGCFGRNDFAQETVLRRKLPGMPGLKHPKRKAVDEYIRDTTQTAIYAVTDGFLPNKEHVQDGIELAARQNCFHPLQDYLNGLKWDGTPRLSTWLATYLGAMQTEYIGCVGRWWMISAIARAFDPGCQADHVLILEGKQGKGKSSAMGILGGDWYVAKIPPIRDYAKAAHAMAGAWIVEMGEMDSFRGAASSQIKDFVSLREDRYQPPYGRYVIKQPRSCVFAGSTNDDHYLRDATGARRFWPVKIGTIDRVALKRDRDQLWAEARLAYEGGAKWWPEDDELAPDVIEAEQEARYEVDEWEAKISVWVDAPSTLDTFHGTGEGGQPKDGLTTGDILLGALGIAAADWTRDAQNRVGSALRRMGWVKGKQHRESGIPVRRYFRAP